MLNKEQTFLLHSKEEECLAKIINLLQGHNILKFIEQSLIAERMKK
jgi:hypothetical protein